jgi:hypothetical protein
VTYNLQTWLLGIRRMPYQGLVADPARGLRRALAHAGLDDADLSFLDDGYVRLEVDHTVMGNPVRMRTGPAGAPSNALDSTPVPAVATRPGP